MPGPDNDKSCLATCGGCSRRLRVRLLPPATLRRCCLVHPASCLMRKAGSGDSFPRSLVCLIFVGSNSGVTGMLCWRGSCHFFVQSRMLEDWRTLSEKHPTATKIRLSSNGAGLTQKQVHAFHSSFLDTGKKVTEVVYGRDRNTSRAVSQGVVSSSCRRYKMRHQKAPYW